MKSLLIILAILSGSLYAFLGGTTNARYSAFKTEVGLKKVDSISVLKAERKMKVFFESRLVKTYHIALGSNSVGPKQFQGDGKTPEGLYYIDDKNPNSDYHKNLGISYPNEADRAYAKQFKRSPGGDIKVHGEPNGYNAKDKLHLAEDWTIGCIAVTDSEIDELYKAVPIGTPILILP